MLRTARLARGISLDHVIEQTRMSPRVVRALDDGRFGDLPGGIYAKAYVRMFAAVVGLDGDVVEKVAPLLPEANDPLPLMRQFVIEEKRARARARSRVLRIGGAAIVDAIALVAIGGAALESVARAAGTTGAAMANASAIPVALVFAALASIYFLLLGGISGSTLGTSVCGIELLAPERRLDLASIVARAWRIWLVEASLLATIGRRRDTRGTPTQSSIGRLAFNCAKVDRRVFRSPMAQSSMAVQSGDR